MSRTQLPMVKQARPDVFGMAEGDHAAAKRKQLLHRYPAKANLAFERPEEVLSYWSKKVSQASVQQGWRDLGSDESSLCYEYRLSLAVSIPYPP